MTATSFPPEGFVTVPSAVAGIELFAPAPEQAPHEPVRLFACPQCGGQSRFSVREQGLACAHCGYREAVAVEAVGRAAEQFEFKVETLARAAHGWGGERKSLHCQNCGSEISLPPTSLTHTCAFCGSNRVIQRASPQEVLRPRVLIPFQVDEAACRARFREWLGGHWLVPDTLKQLASVQSFAAIYLPFWTFDASGQADWRAEVGHTETERYFSDGEWKSRTVTRWRWEAGQVRRDFDDVVVAGTERVPLPLIQAIFPYDLAALVPYEASFLAGFQAQAYEVPLERAWKRARHEMREQVKEGCYADASTSKVRNFSMNLDFADESWRYQLLPTYLATYQYNQRRYQVLVNGQSGRIAGPRPVAWPKVALLAALFLVPGFVLALVGALVVSSLSQMGLLLGVVLVLLGLAVTGGLLYQARGLSHV